MKTEQYDIFLKDHYNLLPSLQEQEEIIEGRLVSKAGHREYQITGGIPRFVQQEQNYAVNFGLQWNAFKREQLDSYSGLTISEKRFYETTKWTTTELKNKRVLEAGSGAGRFTEILLKAGAMVASFDLSSAVDANYENNRKKGNVLMFQGSIYDIPFADNTFDFIFCHGVLQHTPEPEKAYKALFAKLKQGGKISIDYYLKTDQLSPWVQPKYFWRKYTTRMKPERLLKFIRFYIPLWLPVDSLIRKIPRYGNKILATLKIPCWNYIGSGLTYSQRKQWAILDTFDALAATFDIPKTLQEVKQMVESADNLSCEVFYGGNGVVANAIKK